MATPTAIAAYVALFALTGFLFLFVNLLVGWLVRPRLPNQEKLEVYECGEPTIGSSFVQFDLRFYVVALLFIIFDVEVAFFFPWAAVFGKATQLAGAPPAAVAAGGLSDALAGVAATRLRELGLPRLSSPPSRQRRCRAAAGSGPQIGAHVVRRHWLCFSACCWLALRTCGSAATWIGCGP